jgi:hypothetical protein
MQSLEFFFLQHGRVHSSNVSPVMSLADRIFGGSTDAQMRIRPGKDVNSLVWLLWHMASTEDIAVNLVVARSEQVFDDGWARRMNVSRRDNGTGMTAAEVGELSERADVAAVQAYRDAVGLRTRDVVATLAPADWSEILSTADATRLPGNFEAFVGQPRAFELGTSAILHNALHLGEAMTIRGLLG